MNKQTHIAFLLNDLSGGGIEKVTLNLVKPLVKLGIQVDLVLTIAEGVYLNQVPPGVRVINLGACFEGSTKQAIKLMPRLVRYLQQEKPDILLSNLATFNIIAAIALTISRIPVYLVLVEHTVSFTSLWSVEKRILPKGKIPLLNTLMPILMRRFYPMADAIVAVSEGIAQQWETELGLQKKSIQVIYNPVVDDSLFLNAQAPLDHPWFQPDQPPVLLAAGRLVVQKDFHTLIKAFARVRQQKSVRLLILGEGPLREQLQNLVNQLGIEADVSMPGFVNNPYAYMSRAAAFVLSSVWEALPTALIEALACGCQVVATNCPHGPAEILANGKYGRLVPVSDVTALAEAMQLAIDSPLEASGLKQRSLDFTIDRAVSEYLRLLNMTGNNVLRI